MLKWIGAALLAMLAVSVTAGVVMSRHASSILQDRIVETLRASFHARVELESLEVVAGWGFEVKGGDLRIYPPNSMVAAAGAAQPLITLKHFDFRAPWTALFLKPVHVALVKIEGLEIDIPPVRPTALVRTGENSHDKMEILVDEIVCDNSRLVVGTANPNKEPKVFALQHIGLHNVGPTAPWRYEVTLINAIPRGEIQATGNFGPWQIDSPGDTAVTGRYTFQHADLDTIKGIGGILSSAGDFQGKLDRITIDGTTETPDFSLDSANHPVPLHTRFHAIVDGLNGDTYLQPVRATLRNSSFTASGAVIDIKGQGHAIDLDVDIPGGQLRDFLDLAVQTKPAVLTAVISAKAKLHIQPGKERVVQKLSINSRFTLRALHFTNPQVQDKVDMLSLRARGEPEKAKPGAQDVNSAMTGSFILHDGTIEFKELVYSLPGAQVNLAGDYSLDGQVFDFRGHVLTQVPLSKMVQSRWASLALKAVSPFFRGKGGGADIPVRISGTRSAPKFGLDVLGSHASAWTTTP